MKFSDNSIKHTFPKREHKKEGKYISNRGLFVMYLDFTKRFTKCQFINADFPNSQNATALAAATFRESTPWDIGILTV